MERNKIIQQNPWWGELEDADLLQVSKSSFKIERLNLPIVKGKVYLIKGPRRVGKTIYLKQIAKANKDNALYINLDSFSNIKPNELIREIESFINLKKDSIILLDEVQNLKDNCSFLKSMSDLNILKEATVFVTGSDPRAIEGCKQKLIGRSEEQRIMAPLTFRQFLLNITKVNNPNLNQLLQNTISVRDSNKIIKEKYLLLEVYTTDIEKYFDIYLLTGGFPETINCYLTNNTITKNYYEDLIQKIFEKLDKQKTISILSVLNNSLSNSVKYSTISQKTGLPPEIVRDYLFNLSELLLLFEVKEKVTDRLKKYYFKDPFIIHSINSYYSNLDPFMESLNYILNENTKGQLVENVVAGHLHNIYFYNLEYLFNKNKEVDFILSKKAIEVKYRASIVAPNKIAGDVEYLLLTRYPQALNNLEKGNTLAIPASAFLAMLELPSNFL
ncbi:MAG: AAA family ATPase [archaeon]|jgi:predicted AAA+ superfamily ATPase